MIRLNQSNNLLQVKGAVSLFFLALLPNYVDHFPLLQQLLCLPDCIVKAEPTHQPGRKLPFFFGQVDQKLSCRLSELHQGLRECLGTHKEYRDLKDSFLPADLASENCLTSCFPKGRGSQHNTPQPVGFTSCYLGVWIWKWKNCGRTASLEFFWQWCFSMSLKTTEGEAPRAVQVPPASLLPG